MTAADATDSNRGPDWLVLTGDVVVQRPVTGLEPALRGLMQQAELTFSNLEAPLTTAPVRAEKAATQRSRPDRVKDLLELGVDVVTLANNHLMDCGDDGYRETVRVLSDAGISAVGAGDDADAARRPAIMATSGGNVATIGLCAALPPGFAAGEQRPGVAPVRVRQRVAIDPALAAEQPGMAPFVHTQAVEADVEDACAAVTSARERADWVVVGVHWGIPDGFAPRSYGVLAQYQRPLAHRLVDAGADLVVGHHPHAIHPLEVYRSKLIAYSLGNFIFHSWSALTRPAPTPADALLDLGHVFPTEVPAAPYQNPFGGHATRQSVVVRARLVGERVRYTMVPTVMVGGDPVLAATGDADDALRRLSDPPLTAWNDGTTATVDVVHDDALGCLVGVIAP